MDGSKKRCVENCIKRLAVERYGSLLAFCEKEGLEYQTVNKSLSRNVLRSSFGNTMRLCQALKINPYALLEGRVEAEKMPLPNSKNIKRAAAMGRVTEREAEIIDYILGIEEEEIISVPVLGGVSAGFGNELDDEDGEKLEVISSPVTVRADFLLRINGDSMEPKFSDGDLAAVEKTTDLSFGEIGVFVLNGSGYIKVYEREGLVSLNEKYDTIKVDEDDTLLIAGKVLGKAEIK